MTPPPRWRDRPIGELVEVLDGRRIPVSASERASRQGNVPYYGATGQVGWINEALFDEELVLLGEDGVQFFDPNKPKAYRVTGRAWVNNHAHVLRPRDHEIDGRYLTYYLNQLDYRGLANGTTRLKLTQAAMRRIVVTAPPIEEQRRIVDILEDHLSRLDAADAYLRAATARGTKLLDAWMSAASELRSAPRVPLGDLLAEPLRHGRSVPTATAGFPVLRLTAIHAGRIDISERKTGAWTAAEAKPFHVSKGDFLVARGSGSLSLVGRGGLVVDEPDSVAYPDTAIRVRPNAVVMDGEFLADVWDSREVRSQIERIARTTAGIHKINQADMRAILLPVPPVEVQRRATDSVAFLRLQRVRMTKSIHSASHRSGALRHAVLAAAFSGQLTGHGPELKRVEESIA